MKHSSPISGIAVHADQYVATAGYDNRVILWDQATGEPITRSLHDHLANQCAFSPDGTRLVTSSSDYTARLWSVPEMSLLAVFNDQADDVEMSVFHPTEDLVATASRDHHVRIYDFGGGLVHRFEGHTADVISVEWAANGDELITSSDDGTVKRWSRSTGGLVEDIDLGGVETDTVVTSPDGMLYAGNDLGEIVVIAAGETKRFPAHAAGIKRLVLDSSRGLLVSLSYDRAMRLWDVSGNQPILVLEAEFLPDVWPRSCAFGHGPRLVFGTFGASYRTYDYEQRKWLDETIEPTHGVNSVTAWRGSVLTVGDSGVVKQDGQEVARTGSLCNFLAPTGRTILTGGQMGMVLDAFTGSVVHRHRSPLNCAATFEHDGAEHVVIGAYTGEGVVLKVDGPTPEHVCDIALHENAVKGVAIEGGWIFSACANQAIAWHDAATFEEIHRIGQAHDRIVNDCVALGDRTFASVGRDLTLRIWDQNFACTVEPAPVSHSLKCVSASKDGQVIAVGTYDGHLVLFDRSTGTWSAPRRSTASGISSLAFDSERALFLASSYDGQVYPYEVGR